MTITVVSASRAGDGTLTISGTEFTKTTTTVVIDGEPATFEWVSDTELTVAGVHESAAHVEVSKGGVTIPADIVDAAEPDAAGSGQDPTVTQAETLEAADTVGSPDAEFPENPLIPTRADEPLLGPGETPLTAGLDPSNYEVSGMEGAPKAIPAGTWPSPIDTFRTQVAGVALVGLIPVGDEKTPYPTGTPLGSGKRFWLQNGYYKSATPTVE